MSDLYQFEIKDERKYRKIGYMVAENKRLTGIVYTNTNGVFEYIYGKLDAEDEINVYGNNIELNKYSYYNIYRTHPAINLLSNNDIGDDSYIQQYCNYDLALKGETVPPEQMLLLHMDPKLGYEDDRIEDITRWVRVTFEKHKKSNPTFAGEVDECFKNLFPEKVKTLVSEQLPF